MATIDHSTLRETKKIFFYQKSFRFIYSTARVDFRLRSSGNEQLTVIYNNKRQDFSQPLLIHDILKYIESVVEEYAADPQIEIFDTALEDLAQLLINYLWPVFLRSRGRIIMEVNRLSDHIIWLKHFFLIYKHPLNSLFLRELGLVWVECHGRRALLVGIKNPNTREIMIRYYHREQNQVLGFGFLGDEVRVLDPLHFRLVTSAATIEISGKLPLIAKTPNEQMEVYELPIINTIREFCANLIRQHLASNNWLLLQNPDIVGNLTETVGTEA